MIEASLYEHLKDTAAVAAIVAARVYPAVAPQAAAMPAISYLLTNRQEEEDLDGGIGLWKATVQVSCWAATYQAAKELAEAVGEALDDHEGPMGAAEVTTVDDCRRIGELDLVIPPAGDDGRYHVPLDFEITYLE